MSFQRDPLSVKYDDVANDLVTKAIAAYQRKRKNARVRGYVETLVQSPVTELHSDGPDRLTPHERAFSRAMYHNRLIHQLTARKKPDARWSLKLDWQPVPMLPGQARRVHVQVFRDTAGARHAENMPRSQTFAENPDLRSTYAADRQETRA